MPSVVTGANLANRELYYVGVSGDGDSASIGLGQFAHIARRRIDMTYIVDNNGTYGLTKGQFSATNDKGSTSKKGAPNLYEPIDLCLMAMQIGATFVARSFSGDKGQLVPLLKAAMEHRGFAFIDVISPASPSTTTRARRRATATCAPTRRSGRRRPDPGRRKRPLPPPGTSQDVAMPDGSALHKLARDYDPTDRAGRCGDHAAGAEAEIARACSTSTRTRWTATRSSARPTPLNVMDEGSCPSAEQLAAVNAGFR